jgi:xanthine permease XanP
MPKVVQNIFGSAITTGGLSAIILSLILPEEDASQTASVGSVAKSEIADAIDPIKT